MTSLGRSNSSAVFCLVTCFIALGLPVWSESRPTEHIEICSEKVPGALQHANLSFTVILSMRLDKAGVPIRVVAEENKYLRADAFVECLSRWRLPEESPEVKVAFKWAHSVGWSALYVSSARRNRTFVLASEPRSAVTK